MKYEVRSTKYEVRFGMALPESLGKNVLEWRCRKILVKNCCYNQNRS
jgi:hypothetical protein